MLFKQLVEIIQKSEKHLYCYCLILMHHYLLILEKSILGDSFETGAHIYPTKSSEQKSIKSKWDSFSLHGLTRLSTGNPTEKIFWLICLLIVVTFVSIMCVTYGGNYTKYNIYTQILITDNSYLDLPIISICAEDLTIQHHLYCNRGQSLYNPTKQCSQNTSLSPQITATCMFYGQACSTKQINSGCIRVNEEKALKQDDFDDVIEIKLDITTQTSSLALSLSNDVRNTPMFLHKGSMHHLKEPGTYTVLLERKKLSRQPSPYPSHCTQGQGVENYFSKSYSTSACRETCIVNELYRRCGDVIDEWRDKLSVEERRLALKSNASTIACLLVELKNLRENSVESSECQCPSLCEEVAFDEFIYRESSHQSNSKSSWIIKFRYKSLKTTSIIERPLYNLGSLLADIGGIVALGFGGSLVSVVEILVFIVMVIAAAPRRGCRKPS